MSEYQIREGIVLDEICDRYVLISTEAARDKCAYIRKIDTIVAYYWDMMEQGMSVDEMVKTASEQFQDVGEEVLRKDIEELIGQLKEGGYLLSDEELGTFNQN